eukprot:1144323-Pelagomonas_calceolata.AAC.1
MLHPLKEFVCGMISCKNGTSTRPAIENKNTYYYPGALEARADRNPSDPQASILPFGEGDSRLFKPIGRFDKPLHSQTSHRPIVCAMVSES